MEECCSLMPIHSKILFLQVHLRFLRMTSLIYVYSSCDISTTSCDRSTRRSISLLFCDIFTPHCYMSSKKCPVPMCAVVISLSYELWYLYPPSCEISTLRAVLSLHSQLLYLYPASCAISTPRAVISLPYVL